MAQKSVEMLLQDIQLVSEENYAIVMAVRRLMRQTFANVTEEVKYGGILFTSGVPFAGVFSYKAHVSVEFGSGAKIIDTLGFLEGAGKGRRHIKLVSAAQIAEKQLAAYLPLALQAAQTASRAP
jgi:hypothetical protein